MADCRPLFGNDEFAAFDISFIYKPLCAGSFAGNAEPTAGDPTEPGEPEEEDTYAMAYAEDLGISVEEARQRLDIMLEMPALVNEIEENEPTYAAAWIVHQPDLALVVSFTTPDGAEKLDDYLDGIEWADIVSAEQSALSHEELRSTQSLLLEAATERLDLAFESGRFLSRRQDTRLYAHSG